MIPQIAFFVESEPRAKQSFRATGNGGGYTPAYIKAWQSRVGWTAKQHMQTLGLVDLLCDPLTVEMTFFLGNHRRIDLDNLSKAVQDGLNGVVWQDDQQNIRLVLEKYICQRKQGVLVKISPNDRPLEITSEEMNDMCCNLLDVRNCLQIVSNCL